MEMFFVLAFLFSLILLFVTTSNGFDGPFDYQPKHQFSNEYDYDKAYDMTDKRNRWFKNTLGFIMLGCLIHWVWLFLSFVRVHGWA